LLTLRGGSANYTRAMPSSRPLAHPLLRVAQPKFGVLTSLLVLSAALLITAPSAHAQWKWRDKNGQVTASDLPPPRDIADKDILQRPEVTTRRAAPAAAGAASAASATVGAAAPVAETELDKRLKAAEQEKAAKAKADEERLAAQKRDNCSRAREQLATLDSGIRIARVNQKGEREVLDDKARADETRRAREGIAANCR
jgi:Domain of unknown function (DUF4124)